MTFIALSLLSILWFSWLLYFCYRDSDIFFIAITFSLLIFIIIFHYYCCCCYTTIIVFFTLLVPGIDIKLHPLVRSWSEMTGAVENVQLSLSRHCSRVPIDLECSTCQGCQLWLKQPLLARLACCSATVVLLQAVYRGQEQVCCNTLEIPRCTGQPLVDPGSMDAPSI